MARKSDGWVKIHSKLLKEDLTPSQFKFFVGAILLANPPSSNGAGYVDMSVRQLSNALDMSPSEVWRRQQEFADKGMITLQKLGFVINKYKDYQDRSHKSVPPTKHPKDTENGKTVSPTEHFVSPTEHFVSPTEHFVSPTEQSVPLFVPEHTDKKEEVKEVEEVKEEGTAEVLKEPLKNTFGEGQNVLLTSEEYQKLVAKFGANATEIKIEKLSSYMESKGKKYKSHYFTILNWHFKDEQVPQQKEIKHGGYNPPKPGGAGKPGKYIDADGTDGDEDENDLS